MKKIQNEFFPNVTATLGPKIPSRLWGYCTSGKLYLYILRSVFQHDSD